MLGREVHHRGTKNTKKNRDKGSRSLCSLCLCGEIEPMTFTAYLALGSNLGDRRANLDRAVEMLRATPGVAVRKVSSYHETEPVGGPPGQEMYLNAAAELQTELPPKALLAALLEIEAKLGRVRGERFGPRTIDLDLLLYGEQASDDAELTVPHQRMHERAFVLEPLAEIAPLAVHPLRQSTVRDLLRALQASGTQPASRDLAGKRAMVTGSTSGIGRAIDIELAAGVADVIIHGRRVEALESGIRDILTLGVRSGHVQADLRLPADRRRLAEYACCVW